MKERGIGTPWTADEDNLLRQAVDIHGQCDNWKLVAASVPGRTNKACRKRWLHSLSPSIKKTAWTQEEDKILVDLFQSHGPKWSVIARKIPGRTDDACSKRYREALDPSLKKDDWTHNEDYHLLEVYKRLGGKWGEVGRELNRSGLACRNRWRMLERKRSAAARDGVVSHSSSLQDTGLVARQLPPSTDAPPFPWTPALPPMSMLHPDQYWDSHSADYSRLIQAAESVEHSSPFIPTHFSPLSDATQELHSTPSSPPPFQFTSSSLSSALAIPAHGQSSSECQSPNQLLSPIVPPPLYFLPSADTESRRDQISDNSSPLHTTIDVGRHAHDTNGHVEAEEPQGGTAGGSPSPVTSHLTALPLIYTSPAQSLPRLSSDLSFGTAGADHDLVSSHTTTPQESQHPTPVVNTTNLSVQSLSRSSSVEAVGAAREDLSPVSVSPPLNRGSYYRTPAEKAARPPIPRKRYERDTSNPRLSSKLPAASGILAYACGHPLCWPADAPTSQRCFSVSQQLSDHWKVDHNSDDVGENSFRCSLDGCGKGWKSINGLQYHLQISKAHFQRALANIPMPEADASPPSDGNSSLSGRSAFTVTLR
ncbi:hypothetical protein EIP91_008230 [Steccherinum ochraceum]|uniref:Myb-like DNA-binding domain protein n=1 Tax=Steccherinum ochraceum TaxID=92696 RepID=A0A4R0R8V0_9APHY|nr:hypothetical protein EIP91_008230 [Steccherinum ochraceum]